MDRRIEDVLSVSVDQVSCGVGIEQRTRHLRSVVFRRPVERSVAVGVQCFRIQARS